MKPIEPLRDAGQLATLLASGDLSSTRETVERIAESEGRAPLAGAAILYARGALALREGNLDAARDSFEEAERAFTALGEIEAAQLCRIEAAVSRTRRGRRELAMEALEMTRPLLDADAASSEVRGRALIVHGTAYRVIGDASAAQSTFARAVAASADVPEVRSAALNSLGTLCVTLGAFGAAEALCEHAAELCRQRRDTIGEAIAMGQLGAAALGRGDSAAARKYLSRQEWLSSRVGDAFGRTRALVWLAELALDSGRTDDALELTERALASANSVEPPLTTFGAYAERVAGRAKLLLGDRTGTKNLSRARETFAAQRLPLGEALSSRDLALAEMPADREKALAAMGVLASLGLPERVAETMTELGAAPRIELGLAAVSPRRLEPLEARLVHSHPALLAELCSDRAASRRNLGRLAVLALAPAPGLIVVAIHCQAPVERLLDQVNLSAAAVGTLPDISIFAWPIDTPVERLAEDLGSIVRAAKTTVRAVITVLPNARVTGPGFGGGLGAQVESVDTLALLSALPKNTDEGTNQIVIDAAASALAELVDHASVIGVPVSRLPLAILEGASRSPTNQP